MHKITIVIPIHNGETTLNEVFQSLELQSNKILVNEIIFIDDASSDKSISLIHKYQKISSFPSRLIEHKTSAGLASGYNEGILLAESKYIILMHQDIILIDEKSFSKQIQSIGSKPSQVIAYPTILHPYSVWCKYSFWQKCLFSRFVNKKIPMLTGKYDIINKELLLERVGLFDDKRYRTAGEDSDMKKRISISGLYTTESNVEVIHLHCTSKNFSLFNFIKKEAQIAEAQGAVYRKYKPESVNEFALVFFRQILILGLFVPYLNIISSTMIMGYVFYYTKLVYLEKFDIKILILPFVNFLLLWISTWYSIRGFLTGKQTI